MHNKMYNVVNLWFNDYVNFKYLEFSMYYKMGQVFSSKEKLSEYLIAVYNCCL